MLQCIEVLLLVISLFNSQGIRNYVQVISLLLGCETYCVSLSDALNLKYKQVKQKVQAKRLRPLYFISKTALILIAIVL